ncbi:MAG: DUF1800 domain-containing protein [Pirellulaceae bacterium]|nr:DUF1800 domain-containing protein [Pirellulaceae bacterium]
MQSIDPQWAWNEFEPSEARPWNRRTAAHLFRRAGFGASASKLDEAVASTPADTVRKLIAVDADSTNFETQADALARTVIAGGDPKQLAAAWVYRLLYTPAQLLEKTTLFWHGHFATGAEKVHVADMMWAQNQLLRDNALGEFEPLVQAISRDPAMLIYLDSATNRKAHPNENYARELMELFCLGEGNYTEQDVQQLARCFTGWEIKNKKFRKNEYQHDSGTKQLLGKSGDFDGEGAVKVVLEQEAMPYFIVGKLVRFFVFDEPHPTRELLKPLADQFRSNGLKIGPIVIRILGSNLFFSEHAVARKVRSPIELAIGFLRSLEGTTNTVRLAENLTKLGHGLFYPPNVKGWDGGRAWINSSTLLGRANLVRDILNHESTKFAAGSLETYIQSQKLDSPLSIVRWFSDLLLAIPLAPSIESQLAKPLGSSPKENQLREVLHTLSTLPEFQLL